MTFTIRTRGDAGGWTVAEYRCPSCGVFEDYVPRNHVPDDLECPECGESAPWTISSPLYKPARASVTTGKAEPKPHPNYLDTRELGEGMPYNEWKKKRRELHEERRKKRVMDFKRFGTVPT